MRLQSIGIIFFLICVHRSLAREVTHEDIRDALLSMVHMVRNIDDKLERHEFREKALGEQVKKALAGLEKRHKSLDYLKGAISRLDERLSSVETILIQKEEREKQQMKKTDEMIDTQKATLKTWGDTITNMVRSEIKNIPKPVLNNSATERKIENLENSLTKKIDAISSNVNSVKETTNTIKNAQSKIQDDCKKPSLDEKLFAKQIGDTEKLLSKYEAKLTEFKDNITNIQKETLSLGEISVADEAWHNKMTETLEKQLNAMQMIQKSLTNTEEAIKLIPTKTEQQKSKNQTQEILREIQYEITSASEKGITGVLLELLNLKYQGEQLNDTLTKGLGECNGAMDKTYTDILKSYDKLTIEMRALSKLDTVMIQTADNILDTKKRIEYNTHKILSGMSEVVKSENKELNSTLHTRFDDIELSILKSVTGALDNLGQKIEKEMSQIWRQIGIMYQQLTSSSAALDKLQAQTDKYVNGSISILDSMEGKILTVTKKMLEVDENLNFLLGRLSFVTQEFNQVKSGLGQALDDIKSSLLLVHKKAKDAGPGPHYISSSENQG